MKKQKRFPSLMFFAIFFILIGIAALIYPIAGNYLANRQRSTSIAHYDTSLKEKSNQQLQAEEQKAREYNENLFAKQIGKPLPNPEINYKDTLNFGGVMATLDIPAIGIEKMPVYHGTNELVLNEGLGHYENSSIPIGGENTRAVISGHSGLRNQILFTDVEKLKVDDIFYINVLGKRLAYKIQSTEEILPTQVDKVNIVPGEDMVTLLTCTPPGINTFRLLVNGVRVPYEEATKAAVVHRDTFSYTQIVIWSLAISVAIFGLFALIYWYLRQKLKRSTDKAAQENWLKKMKYLLGTVKIFFVLMFVGMIILLAFAFFGYRQIQSQSTMDTIDVGSSGQLAQYNLAKVANANYTESDISSVGLKKYGESKIKFSDTVNQWGIGKLVIPSQNIDLPILAGLDNDNLLSGVATYSETQQFGKGNFVLLSHNIADNNGDPMPVLLGKLNQVLLGEMIYISDFNTIFQYKVTQNEVVQDTEVQYLEQPQSDGVTPIVTLIRCEGGIGTSYRRIVRASLVQQAAIQTSEADKLTLLGLSKKEVTQEATILPQSKNSNWLNFSIRLVTEILSNPLQTIIPISLLLFTPILFLSSIPSISTLRKQYAIDELQTTQGAVI